MQNALIAYTLFWLVVCLAMLTADLFYSAGFAFVIAVVLALVTLRAEEDSSHG